MRVQDLHSLLFPAVSLRASVTQGSRVALAANLVRGLSLIMARSPNSKPELDPRGSEIVTCEGPGLDQLHDDPPITARSPNFNPRVFEIVARKGSGVWQTCDDAPTTIVRGPNFGPSESEIATRNCPGLRQLYNDTRLWREA